MYVSLYAELERSLHLRFTKLNERFYLTGLLMLIGLIGLISTFKAEIGSKLRPRSSLQPPLFTFRYGQSFFLYVIGFIFTEFVGVLNVFLYISLQQVGREKVSIFRCVCI